MKCSRCKLKGYNKNNCPACKEKTEERLNRVIDLMPTETYLIALTYFVLSQEMQKRGIASDILGTGADLMALKSPNAGIFLGGMSSALFEVAEEGFLEKTVSDLESFIDWSKKGKEGKGNVSSVPI